MPAARPTPETPSSFFFNEDLVDISCEVLQCRFQESEVTLKAQPRLSKLTAALADVDLW